MGRHDPPQRGPLDRGAGVVTGDPIVQVRRRDSGAWCVYVRGNFISDHATHEAARTTAQRIARIEADLDAAAADAEDQR